MAGMREWGADSHVRVVKWQKFVAMALKFWIMGCRVVVLRVWMVCASVILGWKMARICRCFEAGNCRYFF
jgi:hypothetical protein